MTEREEPRQRTCAYCRSPIPAQRPPYLVRTAGGSFIGPYHAGCAERIVLMARRAGDDVSWRLKTHPPMGHDVVDRGQLW